MLTDLLLAIAHHLLIFALLAVLVMELVLARPGLSADAMRRLGRLDIAYGAIAAAILVIGFSRVFFGDVPWAFYIYNWVFWAKIAALVAVGLLSIQPTMAIARWRVALAQDAGFTPAVAEVESARRYMHYEAIAFAFIPIFAAMMARGYGL